MIGTGNSVAALLASEPCPPNYEEFYSRRGRELKHEKVRVLTKTLALPNTTITPLAGGTPNTSVFPIETADLHLKDGTTIHLDKMAMQTATTYGNSDGYTPLKAWLEILHKEEHGPSFWATEGHPVNFDLGMVSGITEGLRNAFDLFLDRDDTVLVESEIFCTTYSMLTMTCQTATVDHDDQGMLGESLQDVLSNWHQRYPDRKFPKVLYAITAGNNPTGYTWSQERLLDIYTLCRKYNLIIIEDGAYFYLQYDTRLPSFQSIDIDGRVLRLDTFSKTLGAGFRLGWVTGPSQLIEKMCMAIQFTTMHPNCLSQVVVYNILNNWGLVGFRKKLHEIAEFYKRRAHMVSEAADKYLKDLCTWSVPKAGMFLWLEVKGIEDSSEIVNALFTKYNIASLPGWLFTPGTDKSPAIRISYSVVEEQNIDEAFEKIARAIREYKDSQTTASMST